MEFLKTLNPEQKEAVTFGKGPLLIVAGAGTGKTTVITQRLAWLISKKKANPDEILALTFTEKAAGEMEERVDQLLPYGYVDLWVSTFHAFGERILRDWALEIGLDSGFKLLSRAEQWLLIRQHLDEFDLDYYKPLGNPTRFIQALIQHFSRIKDENITAEEYLAYAKKISNKKGKSPEEQEESLKLLEAAKAYQKYQELLLENGYMDFGDLIIRTLELFQKRKTVLKKFRKQFKYILVDEFQDTNHAQYELLKLLAAPQNNITVVGDDDQAIYRFRGASMSNILEFKKDYPKSQEVILIKNYRSDQNILDLSYKFIQLNNPNRLEHQLKQTVKKGSPHIKKVSKKLVAQTEEEAIIKHIESATEEDEVLDVMREILKMKKKNEELSWNDFAILVRANSQADIFVKTFINQEVPYQFVASRGLYQQPEIIDLISWLRMLDNYHESPSLYRVLNMDIFKLPTLDLVSLLNFAKRKSCSLYESLERMREIHLTPPTYKTIGFLLTLIKKQTEISKEKSVGQVLYEFLKDIGYLKRLSSSKENIEYHIKIQNISKFFKTIQEFEKTNEDKSVKNFIEELKLIVDIGEDPSPAQLEEGPESIKIMTVHGAKGLEFPYVFIVNLVDKRFPSTERRETIEVPEDLIKEILPEGGVHLQEERRLFYVACTRAKKGLYFTSTLDVGGKTKKKPSRFLYEIKIKKETKEEIPSQLNLGFDIVEKKTKPKEKITYPIPERFSYTQLKAYETCPKQYKYAHIWKVPVLAGKYNYSFGSSIHNTLKEFYQFIQAGEIPTKTRLLEIYEKKWIDDWYDSKKHEQDRKKSGKILLEKFYDKNKNNFRVPEYLEKGFNIRIGDNTIRGVIDRVDRMGESSVEIIDYKTGKKPSKKSDIDLDQLLIYHLAMQDLFKKESTLLTFYYLEADEKFSFTASEKDLEKLKVKIKDTIAEIKIGDFTAAPSVHKCGSCDFREICEEREV